MLINIVLILDTFPSLHVLLFLPLLLLLDCLLLITDKELAILCKNTESLTSRNFFVPSFKSKKSPEGPFL